MGSHKVRQDWVTNRLFTQGPLDKSLHLPGWSVTRAVCVAPAQIPGWLSCCLGLRKASMTSTFCAEMSFLTFKHILSCVHLEWTTCLCRAWTSLWVGYYHHLPLPPDVLLDLVPWFSSQPSWRGPDRQFFRRCEEGRSSRAGGQWDLTLQPQEVLRRHLGVSPAPSGVEEAGRHQACWSWWSRAFQVEGSRERTIKGRVKTGNRCLVMRHARQHLLGAWGLVTNSCILALISSPAGHSQPVQAHSTESVHSALIEVSGETGAALCNSALCQVISKAADLGRKATCPPSTSQSCLVWLHVLSGRGLCVSAEKSWIDRG